MRKARSVDNNATGDQYSQIDSAVPDSRPKDSVTMELNGLILKTVTAGLLVGRHLRGLAGKLRTPVAFRASPPKRFEETRSGRVRQGQDLDYSAAPDQTRNALQLRPV